MRKIVAVVKDNTDSSQLKMAKEALLKTSEVLNIAIKIEIQIGSSVENSLSDSTIAEAEAVVIASNSEIDTSRFEDKKIISFKLVQVILKTKNIFKEALGELEEEKQKNVGDDIESSGDTSPEKIPFIVAVTSCSSGIAHTFMAAEGLKKSAEALGYKIKVETQGSVGAKNLITPEEVKEADVVIIAADAFVDKTKFAGKRIYETGTKPAIHSGKEVINTALALPEIDSSEAALTDKVKEAKEKRSKDRSGPYKHLMTGVSYMLPIVVAGGLLIALSFAVGGIHAADHKGTFGWALAEIGGNTAFKLFIPIFSAFIAYSIANRPGITSGLIGGMLATSISAGFLGGILSGFLAGYVTLFLNNYIRLPENLEGIKPVLILPLFSTFIVGLAMIYVIGPPIAYIMQGLANWLMSLQDTSALVLGALLGAMMAFDMGGPVNKAAYTFSVGLLASSIYQPMAATMAAGMVPPLALGLAATLFKSRFTLEEQKASKPALVLGASFITEGAIPFAAADPLRVIPCTVLGAAVTGAISMVGKCGLLAPHGGLFVLAIPNAIQHLGIYIVAIIAGTAVSTIALYFAKKPIEE